MVHKASTFGLVALSMAASFSADQIAVGVNGFVSPRGTPVSSISSRQRSSALHMAVSDDNANKNWDKLTSSSQSESTNNIKPSSDDLESIESSTASSSEQQYTTDQYDGYDGAFPLPDDMEVPETRQLRWEREALVQSKFASDDEVFELRQDIAELRSELVDVRTELDDADRESQKIRAKSRIAELEKELLSLNGRDAEFMYAVSMELMEKAEADGDEELVSKYRIQMEEARLCITQLNMHGLWVGKYGEHGYEMINVTYSGDTLIATKITGDKNVPKGKVTFTVDLSPKAHESGMAALEPIELNPKAARQWGKKYLPRHLGKGQVASENFSNAQWMEGQLILVGRFFSFAWVPIGHQVFFGRPSSELTLKMLKEAEEEELKKDHVAVMRDVVQSMWDETYWVEREKDEGDGYFSEEGCFE